jgi:hypothetical protein
MPSRVSWAIRVTRRRVLLEGVQLVRSLAAVLRSRPREGLARIGRLAATLRLNIVRIWKTAAQPAFAGSPSTHPAAVRRVPEWVGATTCQPVADGGLQCGPTAQLGEPCLGVWEAGWRSCEPARLATRLPDLVPATRLGGSPRLTAAGEIRGAFPPPTVAPPARFARRPDPCLGIRLLPAGLLSLHAGPMMTARHRRSASHPAMAAFLSARWQAPRADSALRPPCVPAMFSR